MIPKDLKPGALLTLSNSRLLWTPHEGKTLATVQLGNNFYTSMEKFDSSELFFYTGKQKYRRDRSRHAVSANDECRVLLECMSREGKLHYILAIDLELATAHRVHREGFPKR